MVSAMAGIAAFLAGNLLAVRWTERRAPAGPVELASHPAPSDPLSQSPARPIEAAPVQAPPVVRVSAPGSDLPSSMAERAKALEPLRLEVLAGLATLDHRIEGCQLRDADVLLTLETTDGGVRVADLQVAAAGAATAEATGIAPSPLDEHAVRCVRRALEQASFKASSAEAGRQWQLAWRPGSRP